MKRIALLLVVLCSFVSAPFVMAQDTTTVAIGETEELGQFLTDAEGMTLYLFTNDEPGVSNCFDQCLANWPAFSAEEPLTLPDGVPGELSLITRSDDGSSQVAYNGWPLYYWIGDQAPGDTTGQNVGEVWFVINPFEMGMDATPEASPAMGDSTVLVAESDELGSFLTDAEGMTLYLFTNDEPGVSNCDAGCLENWPAFSAEEPLTLPEGVPGELSLVEATDGTMIVAYNGWPLYYFAGDAAAGDTNGQGLGDVWFVVEPAEPES